MKKLFLAVLALVMWPAAAQQFEEGVHYEVVAEQASAEPQVQEFFSFYCVHCYRFESVAKAIEEAYPGTLNKAHVSFINYQGMGINMSRAFVAAKQFNKQEEITSAIFKRNFVERDMISSADDLKEIFMAHGIAEADFDKALNSFSVRGMANKMDRDAQNMQVNATPTFVVNGKYKIKTEGFRDSSDFTADFVKAVGFLLEKK